MLQRKLLQLLVCLLESSTTVLRKGVRNKLWNYCIFLGEMHACCLSIWALCIAFKFFYFEYIHRWRIEMGWWDSDRHNSEVTFRASNEPSGTALTHFPFLGIVLLVLKPSMVFKCYSCSRGHINSLHPCATHSIYEMVSAMQPSHPLKNPWPPESTSILYSVSM